MPKRSPLVLFAVLVIVFLAMNRSDGRFFQDDELDTLSWARYGSATDYLKPALSPRFQPNNFRPVGHYYFHASAQWFGLKFPPYLRLIHLFHLLNALLLWMLVRQMGASVWAAHAGTAFFALHMALFDAFSKPMYVFDVLCATFCLLSILLFARRHWILSFVAFWLAYKSKELAVMLPAVLASYEIWFGKRQWKLLIPFFAVSLSFGVQGLLLNPNQDNDYTFRFTWATLKKTSVFYAGQVFLAPYLGFVMPLAALHRNRRTWFGLAMMGLFFFPLLFLPGRLFAAYCYLPFAGLAIALSGLLEGVRPAWIAPVFLVWFVFDFQSWAAQARRAVDHDRDVYVWVKAVEAFAQSKPPVDTFIVDGQPGGFARWGVEGALKYEFERFDLKVAYAGDAPPGDLTEGRVAVLTWDGVHHRLDITRR